MMPGMEVTEGISLTLNKAYRDNIPIKLDKGYKYQI